MRDVMLIINPQHYVWWRLGLCEVMREGPYDGTVTCDFIRGKRDIYPSQQTHSVLQ